MEEVFGKGVIWAGEHGGGVGIWLGGLVGEIGGRFGSSRGGTEERVAQGGAAGGITPGPKV
uniref:Uncharacterized protein n=1 Tax=Candidozyma auris TaxID=498019 RepID=A0A0L0P1M4_CANAR